MIIRRIIAFQREERSMKKVTSSSSSIRANSQSSSPMRVPTIRRRKRRKGDLLRTQAIQVNLPGFSYCCLFISLIISAYFVSSSHTHSEQSQRIASTQANAEQSGHFCQPQTVGQQTGDSNTKKVFCFYDIQDDFRPQDLNPCLCTHVIYSYVAVRKNLSFIAGKKGDLRSLASLKRKNPNLKLLVSLRPDDYFSFDINPNNKQSGEPENDSSSGGLGNKANKKETSIIQMNEMHQKFAKRIRDFIVRHSLDGINLDWPYFAQTMQSANISRDHLTLVLTAINENFQTSLSQSSPSGAYLRLLASQAPILTLSTSKDFYSIVDGYDFQQINKLLDFVHLPAFDFDLNVDQYSIGHPARLHGISDAENLDTLVDLLLSSGLPSEQLVAGIPSHGVQITSKSEQQQQQQNSLNSTSGQKESSSPVNLEEQLEAAANISIVSHSEVCRIRDLVRKNCSLEAAGSGKQMATCWTMSRARDLTAPFAYDSEHWLGFDDETSVKLKSKYVILRQLAGVSMFTVNNDDPAGNCGFGPFPLLATVNSVFSRAAASAAGTTAGRANNNQRGGYFTRAPNQQMTATSLISQIFNSKRKEYSATTPAADLIASASDSVAYNHRTEPGGASSPASGSSSLMSFVDIIEKYGAISRVEKSAAGQQEEPNAGDLDGQLPCEKVGYQRYPRDCSRFYRCVQTPPTGSSSANDSKTSSLASTTTRLQYECPSGLVFDEQYQICNWPSWSAQCTGSGEVNSITNSKFVCPNYGYFQNQENCEYFYYCSDYNRQHSRAYQFRCPFELGFDEEKLQCNWKWLVKGCKVSGPNKEAASGQEGVPKSQEMARKYLESLQTTTTSTSTTTATPITSLPTTSSFTTTESASSTTTAETSVTSTSPTSTAILMGAQESVRRRKRSLEEADEKQEARGVVTSGVMSRLVSFLDAIAAFRESRMKKGAQFSSSSVGASGKPPGKSDEAHGLQKEAGKYPTYVGQPQTGESTAKPPSFRLRRRQSSTNLPSASSDNDNKPSSGGLAYQRPPAPPSIFPFLPASAIYMIVDSLRSYGEVIQGEVNRVLRIAGDRVRSVFGLRGGLRPAGSPKPSGRSEEDLEVLREFIKKLAGGNFKPSRPARVKVDELRRRSKRAVAPEAGDLEALESAGVDSYHSLNRQPVFYQQARVAYKDPLGRPLGYPMNPLEPAAKAAVLGPEPKLFSQPSALVSHQMSPISQQDYERLMERANKNNHNQMKYPQQAMMGSASVLSEQILPAPAHISRQTDSQAGGLTENVLFGMPMLSFVGKSRPSELPAPNSPSEPKRRSKTTMAMKLATLAMPNLGLSPAGSDKPTTSSSKSTTTRGYISFLPSALSNVVVAPARNIMNKAKGINKAVYDLISTLSPGKENNAENKKSAITTPMPPTMLNLDPLPVSATLNHHQQFKMASPAQLQPSGTPLLLTEQEARALSAKLDTLTKEQLEMLSNKFAADDRMKMAYQQQQQERNKARGTETTQVANNPQDYVTSLLKMLSKTSQNPEDIKLLEQLTSQLTAPSAQPAGNDPLIEIGQPDDLALLEALGLIPHGSSQKQANNKYTLTTNGSVDATPDHQQSASFNMHNYNNHHQKERHPIMKAGSMRDLIKMRPQVVPFKANSYVQLKDLGTTKFMPLALYVTESSLRANPVYQSKQQQQETPRPNYDAPSPNYDYYSARPYSYPTTTTTTTTTSSTTPPPIIVSQNFREVGERQVAPVKQTYTELIESNVTTADGIETSFETRTKSAVSTGAGFSINSQIGLGMVPKPFEGNIPGDSPQAETPKEKPAENTTTQSSLSGSSNSTTAEIKPGERFNQQSNATNNSDGTKSDAKKESGVKRGQTSGLSFEPNSQSKVVEYGSQFGISGEDGALLSYPAGGGEQYGQQLGVSGYNQFGGEGGQYDSSGPFGTGNQQQFNQQSDDFSVSAAPGGRYQQNGLRQFAFAADGSPIHVDGLSQRVTTSVSGPQAGIMGSATLNSYNFATQPVSQFEEVVIKKKFKPFPKQVIVPQTNEYTIEEVKKIVTPSPQIIQETSFAQDESFKGEQQPIVQTESSKGSESGFPTLKQAHFEQANLKNYSQISIPAEQHQIKEEEFSTVATSFGESSNAGSSGTKEDVKVSQQFEEEKKTRELQNLQFLLDQQIQRQVDTSVSQKNATEWLQIDGELQEQLKQANFEQKASERDEESSGRLKALGTKRTKQKKLKSSSRDRIVQTESPILTTTLAKPIRSAETGESGGNKVEAAYNNLMMELNRNNFVRSPKNETSSDIVDQKKPTSDRRPKKSANKRSKAQRGARRNSGREANEVISTSGSSRHPVLPGNRMSAGAANAAVPVLRPRLDATHGEQVVAIYGTKSGFMPIIKQDDLSYSSTTTSTMGSARRDTGEPLSSSASFISSKHEALDQMRVDGALRRSQDDKKQARRASGSNEKDKSHSWRNFVRLLSDQISVVNLGNYSENGDKVERSVQVKLVILPASPNNQLLEERNWNYLSSYYPQLFPANRQTFTIGAMNLGPTSLSTRNTNNMIDENKGELRYKEFIRQFKFMSSLIEMSTFRALDEIVQRSRGQMFMMRAKASGHRTIIAVIPAISKQEQQLLSAPTTPTTSTPANSLTDQPTTTQAGEQTLYKAATFSRAIQESIQEAIRKHYDSMKSELKKSIVSSGTTEESEEEKETFDKKFSFREQERVWSTPAPETLVHMESMIDTNTNTDSTELPPTTSTERTPKRVNYTSQTLYEVENAEAKSLYGLAFDGQPFTESIFYKESARKQTPKEQQAAHNGSETESESSMPKEPPPQAKFISIGPHLLSSLPNKLPKVVDQAYANHFYDHISEPDGANKAVSLEESAQEFESEHAGGRGQESKATSGSKKKEPTKQAVGLTEDILVPESACTRAGLFQHPFACNKFYECFWDKQSNKFTLHMFECPIKLAFDERVVGCAMPIESSLCVNY